MFPKKMASALNKSIPDLRTAIIRSLRESYVYKASDIDALMKTEKTAEGGGDRLYKRAKANTRETDLSVTIKIRNVPITVRYNDEFRTKWIKKYLPPVEANEALYRKREASRRKAKFIQQGIVDPLKKAKGRLAPEYGGLSVTYRRGQPQLIKHAFLGQIRNRKTGEVAGRGAAGLIRKTSAHDSVEASSKKVSRTYGTMEKATFHTYSQLPVRRVSIPSIASISKTKDIQLDIMSKYQPKLIERMLVEWNSIPPITKYMLNEANAMPRDVAFGVPSV
jgi:hypothetical protein